eukprot:TRINITY_DN29559_c0_g1_i4.p1 TRINITY_DN29559_c0_g1~~TRINITY_DN29559_c0_g1_i4.p1  ORF type:complete len:610 (+),score=93.96 TRINITY_DN29559_c0_g1_i4:75-1832(+)
MGNGFFTEKSKFSVLQFNTLLYYQKSVSRHSALIRELMRYSGRPDQFMGDVLNQRVRDAAGEAIEAMFSPQSQQPSVASLSNDSTNIKDRIKGMGGNEHVMSSGFSNPTLPAAFSQPVSVNSASKRSVYDKTPPPIGTGKKMEGFGNTSISYEQKFPSSEMPTAANVSWATPPTAISRNESSGSYTEVVKLPGSFNFRNDPASAVKTVGSEEQIVDEICSPGGIRAAPSSEDLKRFVEKCSVLDGDKIATYLETKITDSNWQTKLRALCGLEAVMSFGSTESCMMIVQYFIINPENIDKCRQNQQMSVKEKANSIYQIIGAEHPEQNGNSKHHSAENQSIDLLADLGGTANMVQSAPTNGNVAATDPFGMVDMNVGAPQMMSSQESARNQQQGVVQQVDIGKTVSNELSGLTILDADTTNTVNALDEALFTASPIQQPTPPQQQAFIQLPVMPQQPMHMQQQMQPMPTAQYPTQQYGMQQMQYMQQVQAPTMMMGQQGMYQQPQPTMFGQMQPAMMGSIQPAQLQQQQQYSMQSNPLPIAIQQTQSGGPMSPSSGKKIMTPAKGKVKKDAAFDFVQDHMAGLSQK